MPETYQPSHGLQQIAYTGELYHAIPLAGVPQISDEIHNAFTFGNGDLPEELERQCSNVIWNHATHEIQRRIKAAKIDRRRAPRVEDDED